MTIQTHKVDPHWNYFLAIERDLDRLSRYIEFDEDNFGCFSIEIARVLLASGAEVDVVCKQVCKAIDANLEPDELKNLRIHGYRDRIKARFPDIPQFHVLLPRFGLTLTPWDEWNKTNGVPIWWKGYNQIKHERESEYRQSNLQNSLNAVAGLFVMLLHLYKARNELGSLPIPQLFWVESSHIGGHTFGPTETSYKL